ncbi:MAG TPA: plastocyanin/azurin family copper-binding protein [Actinomycetota bacterium]|nr:plastocyanin/azurin family copper-binding protein [Actinomycetota bacterium]
MLAVGLVACTSGGSGPVADEQPVRTDTVDLPKSYRFEPAVIEVDAGTTVTWTNNDDFPHNVHLLGGRDVTEPLPVGGTATITFDEPGEVPYECSLHPQQMKGTVIVT